MNQGTELLIQLAAKGCVRTKRDAEFYRDEIVRKGLQQELAPVYASVLALLGDRLMMSKLQEPDLSITRKVYYVMKRSYIGESECRCLRDPTGAVLQVIPTCQAHGSLNLANG